MNGKNEEIMEGKACKERENLKGKGCIERLHASSLFAIKVSRGYYYGHTKQKDS